MSEPQPEAALVPNVIGLTTKQASDQMSAKGVTLSLISYDGEPVTPSASTFVADQSPCPESSAENATAWAVTTPGTNPLPDLDKDTYSEACSVLAAPPYSLVIAPTADPKHTVVGAKLSKSQCPIAVEGAVNVGAHVTLVTQPPTGGDGSC